MSEKNFVLRPPEEEQAIAAQEIDLKLASLSMPTLEDALVGVNHDSIRQFVYINALRDALWNYAEKVELCHHAFHGIFAQCMHGDTSTDRYEDLLQREMASIARVPGSPEDVEAAVQKWKCFYNMSEEERCRDPGYAEWSAKKEPEAYVAYYREYFLASGASRKRPRESQQVTVRDIESQMLRRRNSIGKSGVRHMRKQTPLTPGSDSVRSNVFIVTTNGTVYDEKSCVCHTYSKVGGPYIFDKSHQSMKKFVRVAYGEYGEYSDTALSIFGYKDYRIGSVFVLIPPEQVNPGLRSDLERIGLHLLLTRSERMRWVLNPAETRALFGNGQTLYIPGDEMTQMQLLQELEIRGKSVPPCDCDLAKTKEIMCAVRDDTIRELERQAEEISIQRFIRLRVNTPKPVSEDVIGEDEWDEEFGSISGTW